MLRQKLLKGPARLLLLTFVLSTRMAVGTPTAASQLSPVSADVLFEKQQQSCARGDVLCQ
jgi:hypothetical protein